MISYRNGGIWYILNIFRTRGSVFPHSFMIALPPAVACFVIKILIDAGYFTFWEEDKSILKETQAWSGFSFLVGFLIVFRTSQAYNRFWDGCTATHTMRAEWFDACSALVSFCHHSKSEESVISDFKHTLIRLFSMMHAAALAELEEVNVVGEVELDKVKAFQFDLIDPSSVDEESLHTIKESDCRVELIFTWIQLLIVEHIGTGVLSIPPPILSRSFQEIANGMVAFHDAMKISYVPFPFPYAQTCDTLLILHWIVVPFITAQWVHNAGWGLVFSFIPVFCLWSLNSIAVEIENPFGTDDNDLDGHYMQEELNTQLLMLMQPSTMRIPTVEKTDALLETKSFLEVWEEIGEGSVARAHRHTETFRYKTQRPSLSHDGTPPRVSFASIRGEATEKDGLHVTFRTSNGSRRSRPSKMSLRSSSNDNVLLESPSTATSRSAVAGPETSQGNTSPRSGSPRSRGSRGGKLHRNVLIGMSAQQSCSSEDQFHLRRSISPSEGTDSTQLRIAPTPRSQIDSCNSVPLPQAVPQRSESPGDLGQTPSTVLEATALFEHRTRVAILV